MRKISWPKTGTLKAYSLEVPYSENLQTVYVFQSKSTGERETCVRQAGTPEPYPGKFEFADATTAAVVELTGQTEKRIVACLPALEGKISVADAPDADVLAVVRDRKRVELMAVRDTLIAKGFPYAGHIFPLTSDVQTLLMQEFLGAQILPGPYYAWKDIAGEYRAIGDAAAFQAFCMAAMAYGKGLFAREAMLHEMISAAGTTTETEAILWDTVPVF